MKRRFSKLLSALLALAMLLTLLPTAAFAAGETGTFTKITTQEELTSGQYVMTVSTGYAVGEYDDNNGNPWLLAYSITQEAEELINPAANLVWDITVTEDGVTLTDANGVQVAPKGGNTNGIQAGSYTWAVNFTDGAFRFLGTGSDTVTLASNKSSENKFRAYKNTTINAGYPYDFTLYQYVEGTGSTAPDPGEDPGSEPAESPIADGDRVVIYNPTYMKALSSEKTGNYNVGTDLIILDDGTVTGYGDANVWTVVDNGDDSYSFQQDGKNIGINDGFSSLGLGAADDDWTLVALEDGTYNVKNVARGNYLEWYVQYSNWSTYAASDPAHDDQFCLSFYVIPDTPDPDEPETIDIAEALAAEDGTANLTVKGVVTLLDGKNVYLQDSTGGICVRMSANFDDIALGDTVIGTGTRATFNGLPQLDGSTYEKSSGLTMTPAVKTIGELTTADICTYVTIRNVEVTEVYDNNGQYPSPNITVTDGVNSIQLYKAVVGEKNEDGTWPVKEGDVITITGAVGVYNNTLQLRNTLTSEIDLDGTPAGPIADGDRVVIYNPAYNKALSADYSGFYNKGTDISVADGIVRGFTTNDVWTVIDNEDGTWSFSYGGQKLGMADSYTSMTLGEKNDKWELVDAGNGLFYVKNIVRNAYMEYQDNYGTWSAYNDIGSGKEDMFALAFYKVTEIPGEPGGDITFPETFVIYNEGAKGVLAGGDGNETSPSINNAEATVADGVATPANGARVFTVEKTEDGYYRFKTEHDGYLCSNGTGNNAFYSKEATDGADWKLTSFNGGFNLMSRTAKYNSNAQYLEYYSGSYKTYSLYNDSDKDIYTFHFYPVAEDVTITDNVVNMPSVTFGTLSDAYVGQSYTVTFTVDAVFGVADISATYGEAVATPTLENGTYSFTIPASALTAGEMAITVTGTDAKGAEFTGSAPLNVLDEPIISEVFPAPNIQTGDEKQPEIGFTFANAGDEPSVTLTVNGQDVTPTVENGKASYTPTKALADGKVTVTATVTRADEKAVSRTWNFTVGTAQYQLYFGQLHSHTAEYSDGAGTLQEGLNYVANLPESANVDFVAFTDHSNYFDGSGTAANPEAALYDPTQMTEASAKKWNAYTGAVAAFNEQYAGEVVALAGFEMTWSGGPGHINTFNTPGIVSRNNTTLNNKTADAGLKAYYDLLSRSELADSINQFNHPGTTFGNFVDFAYWDPIVDTRIQLVEVGNGEGAIGAGGYYPSYEQYIMALDKGWHVGPTNNQDNHKGKWGNANDARDVILTDDFSQEGIYQAIRDRRIYATEDKNLEIQYTLNGQMLGSIIEEVPEDVAINVSVYDPDRSDSISRVEVVVNSGAVAYAWEDPEALASGELTCAIPASYSYYFIRVTQADGDIAVTAPVWVGETLKLGISSVESGTANPVTDEEVTITTNLFNSEEEDAAVTSITYALKDGETLYTDTTGYTIPASGGTLAVDWGYTPTQARLTTVTVTVTLTQGGAEYTYSMDVTLDVMDAEQLVYIGIDASHYNEYVNGNYKDSMGNFGNLAASHLVRTVELATSEDLIAACENESGKYAALILTAPSRRLAEAQSDPRTYSDAELEAIAAFHAAGGTVIVAGWADHYENYPVITGNPDIVHMAATQNTILEALGSSLRIADDTASDNVLNGGDSNRRLYLSTYNWDSFLVDGVEFDPDNPNNNLYSQLYSHYGGATVYAIDENGDATAALPASVTPVVYGHESTFSSDNDGDGLGGSSIPKYDIGGGDERLMVLATEDLGDGSGLIIVSGAAFMSNFEVQATIEDSGSEKNYSNYTICENLVEYLNPTKISPIAEVQAQELEGVRYTIEGVVTSNASGYDKDTAFFDCIYLQDESAGVNAFPVSGSYKIGDVVRITGTTSSYQGERQIAVTAIEKIGETDPPEPKRITTKEAAQSTYLGSLVQIQGVVVSHEDANGLVQTIMVRDESGYDARVFIDGYITTDKTVANLAVGHEITVTGLSSYDSSFDGPAPRIRVRDRTDIVCGAEVVDIPPAYEPPQGGGGHYDDDDDDDDDGSVTVIRPGQGESDIPDEDTPLSAGVFTDLDKDAWYYDAVSDVVDQGLMVGVSATSFAPGALVSRSMLATVLYRMSGETWEGDRAGFPDVEPNTWYSDAVDWANAAGVVKGYDTGLFGVNDNVTREQLVTMLYRYWLSQGGGASGQTGLSAFADAGSVSDYALEAMSWAVSQGLIQGRPGGLLAPYETATRSELCTILVRFQALEA